MSTMQYFETISLVVACSAVAGIVIGLVMDIGYEGETMTTKNEDLKRSMTKFDQATRRYMEDLMAMAKLLGNDSDELIQLKDIALKQLENMKALAEKAAKHERDVS